MVGGHASHRLIIRFKPIAAAVSHGAVKDRGERKARGEIVALDREPPAGFSPGLRAAWRQWRVRDLHAFHQGNFKHAAVASQLGLDRTFVLEVPPGTDIAGMIQSMSAFGGEVEWVEPDGIGAVAEFIPNDTSFPDQYNLRNTGQSGGTLDADIDATDAWDIHTGDVGSVTLAVVDSGVSPHVEFNLPGGGTRLLTGINTVGDDPYTTDTSDGCDLGGPTGHGTHVAGIAAAGGNNNAGIAGVSWGVNILPVKVFPGCGGTELDTSEGIFWAVDNEADIINISLQFNLGTQALRDAVDYANINGVLVVAAAGNTNYPCGVAPGTVCIPARWPNVMAVSATNRLDGIWAGSRYGPEVDVCAPGELILSTNRVGGLTYLSGTSMATPHVSGLAALIKSYNPGLTSAEMTSILTGTTDDLGDTGFDVRFGFGRINAYRALLDAGATPIFKGSEPPDGAIDPAQPSEPDGTNPDGWQYVDMTIRGDTSGLTSASFSVSQNGGVEPPPFVVGLVPLGNDVFRVVLNRKISVVAWTSITCTPCGGVVRIAFLPGDVNGNWTASIADVETLVDGLGGLLPDLPISALDVDRSGVPTGKDALRIGDLLNGGDDYPPFLNVSLP